MVLVEIRIVGHQYEWPIVSIFESFHIMRLDQNNIWGKVFKNGPSKICVGQLFKNLM